MEKEPGGYNTECSYQRLIWQSDTPIEIEDIAHSNMLRVSNDRVWASDMVLSMVTSFALT
jgi:hypothetical protein